MQYPSAIAKAVALHQAGRLPEAMAVYKAILQERPSDYTSLHFLGLLQRQSGDLNEALRLFESALKVQPGAIETLTHYAAALFSAGRFEETVAALDKVCKTKPDDASIWNIRGAANMRLSRYTEALGDFDRAIRLDASSAEALNNQGLAFHALGRFPEAVDAFDGSLNLRPAYAEALINRGTSLVQAGRINDAIADFQLVLRDRPRDVRCLINLGAALTAAGKIDQAIAAYDTALAVEPNHVIALNSRAELFWLRKGMPVPAIADVELLLGIDPFFPYARGNHFHLKALIGDWRSFDREKGDLESQICAGKRVAQPFICQAFTDSPAILAACARSFAADKFPPLPAVFSKSRLSDRIRVGYVSGEFRQQATMTLSAGLFEQHDRTRFEIFAFDNGQNDQSVMRKRLEGAFDHIVPISDLSDLNAAKRIAEEQIDVLVNLNGYFGASRNGVFARRPAPLQVSYLGFPGTLGADYIDYILADANAVPEGEEQFYAEKIVWLPNSYQINDDKRIRPAATSISRATYNLPDKAFVFCNFNYGYKIGPEIFDVWMRILGRVPGSVLWLLSDENLFSENLKRAAEQRGIDGNRLIFTHTVSPEEHLMRIPLADLILDTLPCNAHTTASDALWMGVPLLACRGTTFAGRVGASLLAAVGLPQLVAETLTEYETLAERLARDPAALASARDHLDKNRYTVPLFDTARTTRAIETAFTAMMDRWQNGEKPQSFRVADIT